MIGVIQLRMIGRELIQSNNIICIFSRELNYFSPTSMTHVPSALIRVLSWTRMGAVRELAVRSLWESTNFQKLPPAKPSLLNETQFIFTVNKIRWDSYNQDLIQVAEITVTHHPIYSLRNLHTSLNSLNREKVQRWDGYHGCFTSNNKYIPR